ncbi:MAG: hypothetical protein IT462_05755 [Planctomycetes bacterium]|nr:hypothetical protein [Planctomycetota bacterium]
MLANAAIPFIDLLFPGVPLQFLLLVVGLAMAAEVAVFHRLQHVRSLGKNIALVLSANLFSAIPGVMATTMGASAFYVDISWADKPTFRYLGAVFIAYTVAFVVSVLFEMFWMILWVSPRQIESPTARALWGPVLLANLASYGILFGTALIYAVLRGFAS